MLEKRFFAVPPVLLTADGTSRGIITIPDSSVFKVKQTVIVSAPALPPLNLEVKRVVRPNLVYLGPIGGNIDGWTDLSAYTVLAGAFVFAEQQNRTKVPEQEVERWTYAEEPTVARRSHLVDVFGDPYSVANPLATQISDGEDVLQVNPDGSINVSFTAGGLPMSVFGEANAVLTGVEATIVSYTVPVGLSLNVELAEFDGDNVARYEFQVNGTVNARKHTWFNGSLCDQFDFRGTLKVAAGDVIRLRVLHGRPDPGQFSGRILGTLV